MRANTLRLLLGAVLTLAACSDHTGPGGGGGGNDEPPPATAAVSVQDDQFVRAAVRVAAGGTVTWTWTGNNLHNVTFNGGPASATQTEGNFQRTFETPGSFSYNCTVHGQAMSGTITVEAVEAPEN